MKYDLAVSTPSNLQLLIYTFIEYFKDLSVRQNTNFPRILECIDFHNAHLIIKRLQNIVCCHTFRHFSKLVDVYGTRKFGMNYLITCTIDNASDVVGMKALVK